MRHREFTSDDGTRLSYRVFGAGIPLICVPGGPGRASEYLEAIADALPRCATVLLENRGVNTPVGVLDPAPSLRLARQVEDIEALRIQLGLAQIDLLAHSSAGNSALLYAIASPDRISSLVLVAPGTRVAGVGVDDFQAALDLRGHENWYPDARKAIDRWASSRTVAESIAYREASAPFFYGRWDTAAREHAAAEMRQLSVAAAEAFYEDLHVDPLDVREALGRLTTPALVVTGELDPFPTPRTGSALAAVIPNAKCFVQPGAGHFPWLDDPNAFGEAIESFLISHRVIRGAQDTTWQPPPAR
jgi:pimeloyl-ACP methyl ester carboxylesterase